MAKIIIVALGSGGGGHAAVAGFIVYTKYLVPTLTVLSIKYTDVPTFVLHGVVAGVLSAAAGKAVLG